MPDLAGRVVAPAPDAVVSLTRAGMEIPGCDLGHVATERGDLAWRDVVAGASETVVVAGHLSKPVVAEAEKPAVQGERAGVGRPHVDIGDLVSQRGDLHGFQLQG